MLWLSWCVSFGKRLWDQLVWFEWKREAIWHNSFDLKVWFLCWPILVERNLFFPKNLALFSFSTEISTPQTNWIVLDTICKAISSNSFQYPSTLYFSPVPSWALIKWNLMSCDDCRVTSLIHKEAAHQQYSTKDYKTNTIISATPKTVLHIFSGWHEWKKKKAFFINISVQYLWLWWS